ncbi:MAG: ATP-dependent RecD-like DNA helicase, partial [Clostridia bacterium]|nr:ATP-dependent RecD-like DNA helicase [Clostridia bacterium]
GIIRGIREKTAQKIVLAFGEDTFDVIENESYRLAEIKGISREKAIEISEEFKKRFGEREAVMNLQRFGLNYNESMKIYRKLKEKSVEICERNPYFFCTLGVGIDFERAEKIASNLPEKPESEYRISAAIIYVLKHNLNNNGHTCVPLEALISKCSELLGCSDEEIRNEVKESENRKGIVCAVVYGREFVFLKEIYDAEKKAADLILFINRFAGKSFPDVSEQIKKAEIIGGVCYNSKQRLAIQSAVEKGVLILTGGPGTGKTTTLRGILRVFEDLGLEVQLAAPTGRAAKRMSELTGKDAVTIHRLLEVEWLDDDKPVFQRNARNPLTAQAVIIDELSMVDINLFSCLLDALPIGCRLIMVGDSNQLPPVGAGNVLHDLIDSKAIPVVELDEVFRQAMESMIITNAHLIVEGKMPELDCKDKDFFFLNRSLPSDASQTICELCSTRLPKAYCYSSLDDIQVLCPSRKGETGTLSLNKSLQELINPAQKGKDQIAFGNRVFRTGDKLMQVKNNYSIEWKSDEKDGTGIFNGDIGILEKIDIYNEILSIRFDDRIASVPFEFAKDIEHAYAVTVHKSQGNEFPAVIIPVTGINSFLVYRNLLYTAVTRARELIILVGSRETVEKMVANNKKQKRYSALKSFIMLGEE